jgi:acyl dehydratase
MGLNYGFDKVRFLQPVRVGKRVRARHRLRALEAKGAGRVLLTPEVTVEIEGEEKPALVAQWLVMQVLEGG